MTLYILTIINISWMSIGFFFEDITSFYVDCNRQKSRYFHDVLLSNIAENFLDESFRQYLSLV